MQTVRVVKQLSTTPDANGKVNVQLENGQQIAIDASHASMVMQRASADAQSVTPQNRVGGNCGSSYIYVNHRSDGTPVHMDTGFDVNHLAVEYAWHAHIAGDSGTGYDYDYHASGMLAFRPGWHGQHSSHKAYPHGTYAAGVYSATSWALLDTGAICFSAAPHDSRYL